MKRKLKFNAFLFVSVITFQIFSGCADYRDICRDETKWIIVYNTHPDPYRLLINDNFISIVQPEDSIVHNMDYGYYNFKFIQESGYDSIPIVYEEDLHVDA